MKKKLKNRKSKKTGDEENKLSDLDTNKNEINEKLKT